LAHFAFAGEQPPVVDQIVTPPSFQEGQGTLRARVRDDGDLTQVEVWAFVYAPSFEAPGPNPDGTLPALDLPRVELSDTNGDGEFVGVYEDFVESGTYRVLVYAEDAEGNISLPGVAEVQTGWAIYLPLVVRNP
jgi:hypothetical protein